MIRSLFQYMVHSLPALILLSSGGAHLCAQVSPEQQAEMLYQGGRNALKEGNHAVAVQLFNEFLQKFNGQPQTNRVRYHLGYTLLQQQPPDYQKALEQFNSCADDGNLPVQSIAQYYQSYSIRALGLEALEQLASKPNEAAALQQRAKDRFQEAINSYRRAAQTLKAQLEKTPTHVVWYARCLAEQAELENRLKKYDDALKTAEPFLSELPLEKTPSYSGGVFAYAYAAFQKNDFLVAGRALSKLMPFDQTYHGLHARYLLGRVYQATGQPAEARQFYAKVLEDYETQKRQAIEKIKQPDQYRQQPAEWKRLQALAVGPRPDFVFAAQYYGATILYEEGKPAEAYTLLEQFLKDQPQSPLAKEVRLRMGFCQVQLKQYPEALATLQPLENEAPLLDQVLYWKAKALAGQANALDATKQAERQQGLQQAITIIRTAADRAANLANTDPRAKMRRAEIQQSLAEMLQQTGLHRDAAVVLETVINENAQPEQRPIHELSRAQAFHLAKDYDTSRRLAEEWIGRNPEHSLRTDAMLLVAENTYFRAVDEYSKPDAIKYPDRWQPIYKDAIKQYQAVLTQGGEFPQRYVARYSLAMSHFRMDEYDQAISELSKIPTTERIGELAYVNYLLADSYLRQAPATVRGAIETRKVLELLQKAIEHLESFVGIDSTKPADQVMAMYQLGTSQLRVAELTLDQNERGPLLQTARQTFEKLQQQFPQQPQATAAIMERAKCLYLVGDHGGSINELRKFTQDPQQQSPYAPFALMRLATILRQQNQAEEAVKVLQAARDRWEQPLAQQKDKLAQLRYQHGLALQQWGKYQEAFTLFKTIPSMVPQSDLLLEAELRASQCRIQVVKKQFDEARQKLQEAGNDAGKISQAKSVVNDRLNDVIRAGSEALQMAQNTRTTFSAAPARERLFYEAAWAARYAGEYEIREAQNRKQKQQWLDLRSQAKKELPEGADLPYIPQPVIAVKDVTVQHGENVARSCYNHLIKEFSDTILSVDARLELAEMHLMREEYDPAIQLLKDANDLEPSGDEFPTQAVLDKVKVRLGTCLAAKKEWDDARNHLEAVANNEQSPVRAQAILQLGECLLAKGDHQDAAKWLTIFKDNGQFHWVNGVSDQAVVRLGQALAGTKQWDAARQAYDLVPQRYGSSRWMPEARYGMGWAFQQQGQHDQAVQSYQQVINLVSSDLAAKAHLQIGLCRLEQKRYGDAVAALLIVPYTFDERDLHPIALCEAARALVADGKPAQAKRLLERVVKDYPKDPWAAIAKERLTALNAPTPEPKLTPEQ
ncbi:MAG: tetratricopeptide repeat protein [Zavarzinella sp.]